MLDVAINKDVLNSEQQIIGFMTAHQAKWFIPGLILSLLLYVILPIDTGFSEGFMNVLNNTGPLMIRCGIACISLVICGVCGGVKIQGENFIPMIRKIWHDNFVDARYRTKTFNGSTPKEVSSVKKSKTYKQIY